MTVLRRLVLIIILFLTTACQGSKVEVQVDAENDRASEIVSPTVEATPTTVETPTSEPTSLPQVKVSEAQMPSLFDVAWHDRGPFKPGLIPSEQLAEQGLLGATVYHMDIQLDDSLTIVQGKQEFYYTNQESIPLEAIYLHLFPNLLGGELTIAELNVAGQAVAPTYLYESSVIQVPLETVLQPGESVIVDLSFLTLVPVESGRNYGILATIDDILALAHFYPIVALHDEDGWHIEPPAPQGDVLVADTSFYLVRVSAPAEVVIAASGIELERQESNENQVVSFAAGPMRDFYLAASQRFRSVSARVGQTIIHSYAPREMMNGAEMALDAATSALSSFSNRFGTYPYTELDIVSTPTLALGVEYPGIFANAIGLYDPSGSTAGLPNPVLLESVTAHEAGHQWFYGIVGNDQLDEPWLDEAVTQYATWLYFIDRYGRDNAEGFYQSLISRWARVESARIPIGLPVAAYEGPEYSAIVYGRGPLFLDELATTVGQERFDTFLREYYATYQWQIATTEGFKQLLEEQCDCDLTTLFEDWVYAK